MVSTVGQHWHLYGNEDGSWKIEQNIVHPADQLMTRPTIGIEILDTITDRVMYITSFDAEPSYEEMRDAFEGKGFPFPWSRAEIDGEEEDESDDDDDIVDAEVIDEEIG